MGCGGSKFESGTEKLPPRLRPLLRQRFEEMRKHRNAVLKVPDNLSKKELLKDVTSDDENFLQPHEINSSSFSSQEDRLKVAPAPESDEMNKPKPPKTDFEHDQKDNPAVEPQSGSSEESEKPRNETNITQDTKDKEAKDQGEAMVPIAEKEEIGTVGEEQGEEKEKEQEEEDSSLSSLTEECDCVGAPSFRVYFIESLGNIKADDDKDYDSDKKSLCDDCSMKTESVNSNADSVCKTEKKGKKRRSRLRRVIPKGRPGGVKNLLNVKSCYNPACAGLDKTHLLDKKKVD